MGYYSYGDVMKTKSKMIVLCVIGLALIVGGRTIVKAQKKAQVLMQSVSNQTKNKILTHILGLIGIACTVISSIGVFVGVTAGWFFVFMTSMAVVLMGTQFLVRKTMVNKELDVFYAKYGAIA